ncbi:MAG: MFS transporter [Anaerolineales bacterium]
MNINSIQKQSKSEVKSTALSLILMMGLVSALGDIVYESARSVSGPYLALLGASAVVVGSISGLGEFLGYGLRLVSGYIADRTRAYWVATFIGYGLILCIPLLAFAGRWEIAAGLLILERIGKAIRSPARDTILSHAAHQMGRGWGFAIHEFLDQLGAIFGPLLLSAAFLVNGNYRAGFNWLWLPAILVMVFLTVARLRVPAPERLEKDDDKHSQTETRGFSKTFWIYAVFTFFSVGGFASFQLLSFHWLNKHLIAPGVIPVLYALAMGVDALAALAVGKMYDRIGLISLAIVPVLTLFVPFLGFSSQLWLIILSVVVWGIVMAIHETIMRAAIADIAQIHKRGTGYGIFNTLYGAAWFIGGSLMGWLYQTAFFALPLLVLVFEVMAIGFFVMLKKEVRLN